ncbi:hypothetical protein BJV85_002843 [Clostridium acetobutylicum]|uniref:Uncharacterized protein n=1 Tax=Clostridium acetobutylicum (strain ATCC 824 / DSM 792 / JCM 1419 / IAM 19013 / LMG 5710 / NBRC 13948 / NRRL B-527 / VKM B-1787 / 2291 / W) TaxID=272562 RepID=Q97JW7_CLOAB|nr:MULTISPECIES: hypothetical protein [Clostridium]AAK79128.1 Hypothetical protein CA_C1156 [Clostridium acetobutylicum ATCC 824]ADZ20206.1 Conserved hypothetical protein [Clostridium acetobutylicum EA 2018]AEI31664.1 hypothetical protein SMB_G1176 [Clostridium acetobutylicum DSM 1731]AWV81619.1 hypothetical protein DK921_16275 [Clostridium acetobutylicum]MBC2393262.1 hypothetical protein [Clostridium acetobutylicum]
MLFVALMGLGIIYDHILFKVLLEDRENKNRRVLKMSEVEKEQLLQEYIDKHNNRTCDCNEQDMELCLGGLYLNGLLSKEEIFEDWD